MGPTTPPRSVACRVEPAVTYIEARKRLADWLRRQLIGPVGEGSLGISPLDRYPTGVLHPVDPDVSGIDPTSAGRGGSEPAFLDDREDATPADGEADGQAFAQPARRRRYVPPSRRWASPVSCAARCAITHNWRGKPLRTFETVVDLIGNTRTGAVLRVRAEPDKREYPKECRRRTRRWMHRRARRSGKSLAPASRPHESGIA